MLPPGKRVCDGDDAEADAVADFFDAGAEPSFAVEAEAAEAEAEAIAAVSPIGRRGT